jgi:hypothetical protein
MMSAGLVTRIQQQLQGFVEALAGDLGQNEHHQWCGRYLRLKN